MQPGLTRIADALDEVLLPDTPDALHNSQLAVERAVRIERLPLIATSKVNDKQMAELSQALAQMRSSLPRSVSTLIDDSLFNACATGAIGHAQVAKQAQILRAAMRDDFVLMTATHAGPSNSHDLQASLLAVAMPSGWDPAKKLGQGFLDLHQPVADAEMIRRAAPSLCTMMRAPGALRRHVWTLANTDDLSRHPSDMVEKDAASIDDVWFRCERQTTFALLDGAVVLFVIRVYVERLTEVLAVESARARTMLAALRSMSGPVIAYKSLQQIQPLVVRVLEDEAGLAFPGTRKQHE